MFVSMSFRTCGCTDALAVPRDVIFNVLDSLMPIDSQARSTLVPHVLLALKEDFPVLNHLTIHTLSIRERKISSFTIREDSDFSAELVVQSNPLKDSDPATPKNPRQKLVHTTQALMNRCQQYSLGHTPPPHISYGWQLSVGLDTVHNLKVQIVRSGPESQTVDRWQLHSLPTVQKKKRKPKDPNQPAGHINAYNFFAMEFRAQLKKESQGLKSNDDVNKLLGQKWKALPSHMIAHYQRLSDADRIRYFQEWEDYKPADGFKKVAPRIRPRKGEEAEEYQCQEKRERTAYDDFVLIENTYLRKHLPAVPATSYSALLGKRWKQVTQEELVLYEKIHRYMNEERRRAKEEEQEKPEGGSHEGRELKRQKTALIPNSPPPPLRLHACKNESFEA